MKMTNKKCAKCGISKEISLFYYQKTGKDGLLSTCKACSKLYKSENADRMKVWRKTYTKAHSTQIREYMKIYYLKNKESIKKKVALYKENYPERVKEYNRKANIKFGLKKNN